MHPVRKDGSCSGFHKVSPVAMAPAGRCALQRRVGDKGRGAVCWPASHSFGPHYSEFELKSKKRIEVGRAKSRKSKVRDRFVKDCV